MPLTIGLDMDGVLCDFVGSFLDKVKNFYGVDIKESEIIQPKLAVYVNDKLPLEFKRTDSEQLYFDLCTYHFFRHLKPYAGAIEAVKTLATENKIVFITRPVDYRNSTSGKESWLREYFSDIKYDLVFVSSFEAKRHLNVDMMVDDDPRVMNSLTGQIPIMVNRPWNKDYSNWCYRIDELSCLPSVIGSISKF
jgi:5'(3')-deoxyribonucleotidase